MGNMRNIARNGELTAVRMHLANASFLFINTVETFFDFFFSIITFSSQLFILLSEWLKGA